VVLFTRPSNLQGKIKNRIDDLNRAIADSDDDGFVKHFKDCHLM
jgi:hypothetical protein